MEYIKTAHGVYYLQYHVAWVCKYRRRILNTSDTSPDPLTGESRETPYISAHFLLDGCKGHETLWHELVTDDFSKVKRGVRVRPVWNPRRIGAITDIKYFEIVE